MSRTYLRGTHDNTNTLTSNTTNDDSSIGRNSKATFTANTSNTYYISAGAYSNDTTTFTCTPNRSRYQKTQTKANSTTTITTTYIGKLYEQIKQNTHTEHKHFIYADGQLIAINIKTNTTANTPSIPDKTRYLHYDNLGSIDTITNGQGNIVERMAYTAFGQRRQDDWRANDPLLPIIPTLTNRGFTGHEHIDEMGFIHMNGRVYDPSIGRFLSADPNIQAPYNTQSYNRYSYVLNNPLKYTDPSGFWFMLLGDFVSKLENLMVRNRTLRVIGMVAAFAVGGPAAVAALSARLTHLAGGSEGDVIKAGITAGLASLASVYASEYVAGISGGASQVMVGGLSGGAISLISGGNFQDGFIGGLIGTIAGGYMGQGSAGWAGRTAIAAAAGGVVAELGGGKFANGALSAAFVHLFRESIRPAQRLKVRFSGGDDEIDGMYSNGEEAYNAGAEDPNASMKVRDQLLMYAQTPVGAKVMSQRGTLTIYPDNGDDPSASIGRMSINYNGRNPIALAHEMGHTIFGGGYVDYRGQGGCSSCPVGNVQVHENPFRRAIGKRLRKWYPNPNGQNFNVDGIWEGHW
ncbi:hypothetical protein MS2017_0835 [Bathymodiolus thermophilus thioautotrophic gill symbiont]|uniref:RHS repeat-associated core domain-containing protein n=1 Tax=Bathymodiolus thermophilus thioautotrophic gill symbiont TaxID=2360 RepID=A0A3G3IL25_9GAMM|nr:RHS repeat-associated core domain-containing protein [Bathymodiolus thermophilus thioautotrophic gill symbiont]AYQ56557.1 hypothetical protein MS2017_0835 [Bathymodiolus thermophilus thioautotrophic gill symbiont]